MKFLKIPLLGGVLTVFVLGSLVKAPYLGFFLMPFLALPISAISVRWGLGTAMQSLVLGFMLSLPLFGLSVIPVLLLIGMISILFHLSKANANHLVNYLIAASTVIFIILLTLFFQYEFMSGQSLSGVSKLFEQAAKEIQETSLNVNMPQSEMREALKEMNEALDKIKFMLPSLYGVGLLGFLIINLLLTKVAAYKLGNKEYVFEPFKNWDIHWLFSWGFVLGIASQLFDNKLPGSIQIIGMNFAAFFTIIFIIQGIAVGAFFFSKWKVPAYGKALSFIAFLLLPPLLNIVSWIGLFDVWFNYRKLSRAS